MGQCLLAPVNEKLHPVFSLGQLGIIIEPLKKIGIECGAHFNFRGIKTCPAIQNQIDLVADMIPKKIKIAIPNVIESVF